MTATTNEDLGADRSTVRPASLSDTGFDGRAFEPASSEREIDVIPEDPFPDFYDRLESTVATIRLQFNWLARPSAIVNVFLAIAVAVLARQLVAKPNVMPFVQTVHERCLDPKCKNTAVDVSELQPLDQNEKAQTIVAQAMLPVIFHQMFTVSTPDQDRYDWNMFVVPFLEVGSPASQFATQYLQKNRIAQFAANGMEQVTVDPVSPPTEPNTYLVSWTMQSVSLDGSVGPKQRNFARVIVKWGDRTGENRDGMYLHSIELVQSGQGQGG